MKFYFKPSKLTVRKVNLASVFDNAQPTGTIQNFNWKKSITAGTEILLTASKYKHFHISTST